MRTTQTIVASLALAVAGASHAQNVIDLELSGPEAPVAVGQTINVQLRARRVPTDSFVGMSFVAIDSVLAWDPSKLTLLGTTQTGAVPLLASYFPAPNVDTTGINEASVPQDGTALHYAIANFGAPVQVSTSGVLVTTFRFRVKAPFQQGTMVELLPDLTVLQRADTAVYDGTVPGLDVLGSRLPALVTQRPGDLDGSGIVDGNDLGIMLSGWGSSTSNDVDGSGTVDGNDLGILLASWGASSLD
ncbi:MAG: hypothetical protein ACO3DS_01240 [Phycisphaerales bacterium]